MRLLLIILFSTVQIALFGQNTKPKPKPNNTPVAKTRTPKVVASIGGLVSGNYSVGMAKMLIDSNLVIRDENGKFYPIHKCTFLYRKKMTYKDDITGETKTSWEYLGKDLKNNEQLDKVWRDIIKEDLKKGESLIFEKILANSQKGYMLQVKSITINVE